MQRLLVFAAICVALIQAHGSLNPCPEDIQTCLDAGASCEDLSATYDYFCAPGSAATNSFILGCVCAPLPTIGQPCNATCTDVKYEPICHDDGTGGVCRWVGIFGPGETCVSGDSNFVNGGCIAGTTCQSGKCSGTQTLAASGKACTSDTDCKFGLACLYDNKGTKVCGKPWSSPVGNGCDSSEQCEPGAFCNTDGGANVCALLTGINVDCTGNTFGCYGVTYPEEPLTCSCAYEEGSTPANFTTTGVGTCRPSLTWVPNKATRDAWNSFQSCLSDNKCARGTGFGPGSCMDQHCATQYAALQLSMNKVGKRTCAQLAQLPFLLGGDTSAAASTYIASALLAVLVAALAL